MTLLLNTLTAIFLLAFMFWLIRSGWRCSVIKDRDERRPDIYGDAL